MSEAAIPNSYDQANSLPPPRALESILLGGLAVGVQDILDAITFSAIRSGTPPARVLQSVAAGLLGRDAAFGGGEPGPLCSGLPFTF
jgi:hypothetical protein